MKRSITVEDWTVQLRVRVLRKKRKVNGRTRGRYEGKTAHLVVRAPGGDRVELYLGSGAHLAEPLKKRGEENAAAAASSPATSAGGRIRGKNDAITDAAARVRESETYARRPAERLPRGMTMEQYFAKTNAARKKRR